jgi:hypothetical protein
MRIDLHHRAVLCPLQNALGLSERHLGVMRPDAGRALRDALKAQLLHAFGDGQQRGASLALSLAGDGIFGAYETSHGGQAD